MPCLSFSTDDVLNNNNNDTEFTELKIIFVIDFRNKIQEGSVLKYINFQIFECPLVFRVDHTDNIMELVHEWFPPGKFRRVDTPFRK